MEIKFEETATSTNEVEQRADGMSQEPAVEDLSSGLTVEEAIVDEPVLDTLLEEPAEEQPLTDVTQPVTPTTPIDDVESLVEDEPEEPDEDVGAEVEEPIEEPAGEPAREPLEPEGEPPGETTPQPEHDTADTADGRKEQPSKTNVESFFIDDKVVVLPRGEKVALLAPPATVEKVRNMLKEPDVSYELYPTPPPGKTYILVVYKGGLSAGTYRCKPLSEDFNLL